MMDETDEMPEVLARLIGSDLPPMQKCFAFVREGILLGYLRKGRHIVERELADLLKISRTPVREAVRQLEKEGLLIHYPNRGCLVVGFTAKDIVEMYELRILLECFLIRKIVEVADEASLRALRQEMKEDHENGEEKSRENFHMRLLNLAQRRWLSQALKPLEEYIARLRVLSFLRKGREEAAYAEHMEILDALIAKDAENAAENMTKHLNASLKAFLAAAPFIT